MRARTQVRNALGTFTKVSVACAIGQHVVWQIGDMAWQVIVGSVIAGLLVVIYNWADNTYPHYGLGAS